MKTKFNNTIRIIKLLISLPIVTLLVLVTGCNDDEPTREDTPEMITRVTLTFSPVGGGAPVVVTASDPDGEGVQDITIDGPIDLAANESYTLGIEFLNELANPGEDGYDITEEVEAEGDEHMIFYSWTNNLFANPEGDGNIDNRSDPVNYDDEDDSGFPIGLLTSWTTGDPASGTFRLVLKHQPDLKSASSTSATGETDVDLEFEINVE